MKTVVLYHKSCTDGYVSALNFYAYYKEKGTLEDVVFIPVQYGERLPDIKILEGNMIYVLDFSFSKEDTIELLRVAGSVSMLDHHKKAIDTLFTGEKFISNSVVENDDCAGVYLMHTKTATLYINNKESGATLAYNEIGILIQNDQIRGRLQYLSDHTKDRDLWIFSLKDTLAVYEYINTFNNNLQLGYEHLLSNDSVVFFQMLEKSQTRVDMRNELAKKYANRHQIVDFLGYKIPMVNVTSDFSSIVGDILNKNNSFALTYATSADKVYVSLRSDKNAIDVNEIAKLFGGGGHVNAAGFSLPIKELPDLLGGKYTKEHLQKNKTIVTNSKEKKNRIFQFLNIWF
jgi:oligoribonuclease NrnB/cAMP/cGMP phosphodiesterase (DHH superfamily)